MKHQSILIMTLGLLLAIPSAANAMPGEARGEMGPGAKAHMKERMKQHRGNILRDQLGLDATRTAEVNQVWSRFDPDREKLHRRKKALRFRVKALLAEESDDEGQYEAAIREFQQIEEALMKLRGEEMKALKSVLSAKERVQLHISLHRLHKRMKRAMKKHRRGPDGACGGPDGEECRGDGERRKRRGDRGPRNR